MNSTWFLSLIVLSFFGGYIWRLKMHRRALINPRKIHETPVELIAHHGLPHALMVMITPDAPDAPLMLIPRHGTFHSPWTPHTPSTESPSSADRVRSLASALSWYVINVGIPVTAFCSGALLDLSRGTALFHGAALAWLSFGFAALLIHQIGSRLQWTRPTIACLMLTAGLANTAMLGYPIVSLLYGPGELANAVMLDQFGSFLALSTAGLFIVQWSTGDHFKASAFVLRVVKFPPFAALCAGLLLNSMGAQFPEGTSDLGVWAGRTVGITGMIALGLQSNFSAAASFKRELGLGLAVKLVLVPAIAIMGTHLLGLTNTSAAMQLAMPSLMSASVLATRFNLNRPLAALMPTIGLLPALISVPIWFAVTGWLAG